MRDTPLAIQALGEPIKKLIVIGLLICTMACGSSTTGHAHQVGTVTLVISGGFTGWVRTLTVDPDGMARLTMKQGPAPTRGPHAVTQQQLAQLRSVIANEEFARLKAEYPAPPGGADLQTYDLTADVDGKQLHTITYDGANRPQVLSDALSLLNDVLVSFAP